MLKPVNVCLLQAMVLGTLCKYVCIYIYVSMYVCVYIYTSAYVSIQLQRVLGTQGQELQLYADVR
jgi:hypothetical protein